jgi:hypothetical protein
MSRLPARSASARIAEAAKINQLDKIKRWSGAASNSGRMAFILNENLRVIFGWYQQVYQATVGLPEHPHEWISVMFSNRPSSIDHYSVDAPSSKIVDSKAAQDPKRTLVRLRICVRSSNLFGRAATC